METNYTNAQLAQDYFDVASRYLEGGADAIRGLQATAARIRTAEINLADFYQKNQTLKNNGAGIGYDVRKRLEAILCAGKEAVIQKIDDREYSRRDRILLSGNRNDKMRADRDSDSEILEKTTDRYLSS